MARPAPLWWFYTLFNDPPGNPGLKCVGCKVALSGTCLTIGGASLYGAKRTIKSNVHTGTLLGIGGVILVGLSLVFAKHASEVNEFNKRLLKSKKKDIRENRLVNSG